MRETTRSRFCAFLAIAALAAAFARASYVSVPDGLEDRSPGNHGNAGGDPVTFSCELDPKLTEADFPFFVPDIQGNWGQACGRNRGVFVLDPPDGHTYGCGNLPEEWGVASVADLTNLTKTQPETALNAYANLVAAIYNTTIGKTAEACDFDALTILTCGREEPWKTAPWYHQLLAPIRAVNIGGLFVLERWIVPNFTQWGNESGIRDQSSFCEKCEGLGTCDDLKDHWKNWYKPDDFKDMKESGLNSVRLPVGWWYFAEKSAISRGPYIVPDEDLYDRHHPITDVIRWAKDAGLYVILDLHGAPGSQNGLDNSGVTSPDPNELVWGETWMYDPENYGKTVRTLAAMAEYINHIEDSFDLDNVMALELLNEPWAHLDLGRVRDFYVTSIEAVRLVRPTMPIIVHDSFRGPMWATLLKNFPFENIVMDTHIYHGFNPADLSSDTAESDRQKMYVHERMACSYTSMLRYQTCACLPVFVGEWSLAIDNCMPWLDSKFADFGQCNNLAEREKADWWTDHTRSFAMRQIAMYEREMGWSFWTWKLEDDLEKNEQASKYWSFRLAVEHGFIDTKFPSDSCKHPPVVDWMKPLPTSTTNNNSDNNDSRHGLADDQQPTDLPATTTTTGPEEARGGPDEAGAIGGGEGGGLAEQQAEGASPELGTADTPGSAARSSPSFMTMTMLVMVGAMVGMAAAVAMDRLKHGGNGGSGGGGGRGGGHGELGSRGAVGAGNWMSAVFSPGYETIGSDSTP